MKMPTVSRFEGVDERQYCSNETVAIGFGGNGLARDGEVIGRLQDRSVLCRKFELRATGFLQEGADENPLGFQRLRHAVEQRRGVVQTPSAGVRGIFEVFEARIGASQQHELVLECRLQRESSCREPLHRAAQRASRTVAPRSASRIHEETHRPRVAGFPGNHLDRLGIGNEPDLAHGGEFFVFRKAVQGQRHLDRGRHRKPFEADRRELARVHGLGPQNAPAVHPRQAQEADPSLFAPRGPIDHGATPFPRNLDARRRIPVRQFTRGCLKALSIPTRRLLPPLAERSGPARSGMLLSQ